MRNLLLLSLLLLALGCNKAKLFDGPDSYADDFEQYATTADLVDGDDQFWSYFQETYPNNSVSLDSSFSRSGSQCMVFRAEFATAEGGASKASMAKQKMAFFEGDTASISAWYYIEGDAAAQWMFLMDFEEQAAIGAGPGMRLALVDDAITLEHKYPNPNVHQPSGEEILFPRDQWVHLRMETLLSQRKDGYVKVYQDGALIIDQDEWNTLPKDILYFQQGTKGMYTSIEFGITANTSDSPMTIYVDDVVVENRKK